MLLLVNGNKTDDLLTGKVKLPWSEGDPQKVVDTILGLNKEEKPQTKKAEKAQPEPEQRRQNSEVPLVTLKDKRAVLDEDEEEVQEDARPSATGLRTKEIEI